MLCLSFINSVIRKLRQIKTQPSYRRDNKLHRNCNLTLPCQSHIYQQSVTAASYSFFYDPAGFFRNILHSSLGGGQNFPRIRASEPSPRLPPHWQYGETKHLKFINVFEKKIESYALNILKNNKKNHSLLSILTLSKVGITLYLSHLVPALPVRFVLLDFSSTY